MPTHNHAAQGTVNIDHTHENAALVSDQVMGSFTAQVDSFSPTLNATTTGGGTITNVTKDSFLAFDGDATDCKFSSHKKKSKSSSPLDNQACQLEQFEAVTDVSLDDDPSGESGSISFDLELMLDAECSIDGTYVADTTVDVGSPSSTTVDADVTISNTGSGQSHNNIQPIWLCDTALPSSVSFLPLFRTEFRAT